MKNLAGKKALITGAASGIGRALARALASEGVDLYLIDVQQDQLAEVVREAKSQGVTAVGHVCDLSNPSEISELTRSLLADWDGVDILVNNAGIAYYGRTDRMTAEQCDRVMAVNLLAPMQLVRELLPAMLSRAEAHILNVSSIAGLVAVSRGSAYHTTKFGIQGLSEALRAEYGKHGIGVTALCPGFVRTGIFESAMNDRGERGMRVPPRLLTTTPEVVAARGVRAIRRNDPMVVITLTARVTWWLKRLFPTLLLRIAGMRRGRRQAATAETRDDPRTIPVDPSANGERSKLSTDATRRRAA